MCGQKMDHPAPLPNQQIFSHFTASPAARHTIHSRPVPGPAVKPLPGKVTITNSHRWPPMATTAAAAPALIVLDLMEPQPGACPDRTPVHCSKGAGVAQVQFAVPGLPAQWRPSCSDAGSQARSCGPEPCSPNYGLDHARPRFWPGTAALAPTRLPGEVPALLRRP